MTKSFDRQQEEIDDILSNNKDDYFVWYMGTSPFSITDFYNTSSIGDYMSYYIEELSDEEYNQYFGNDDIGNDVIDGYIENGEKYKKVMNEIKKKPKKIKLS